MHDIAHYKIHCCTQYLSHSCITYVQQFTIISIYILISAAEIV